MKCDDCYHMLPKSGHKLRWFQSPSVMTNLKMNVLGAEETRATAHALTMDVVGRPSGDFQPLCNPLS